MTHPVSDVNELFGGLVVPAHIILGLINAGSFFYFLT